jgi:hypothetical protein
MPVSFVVPAWVPIPPRFVARQITRRPLPARPAVLHARTLPQIAMSHQCSQSGTPGAGHGPRSIEPAGIIDVMCSLVQNWVRFGIFFWPRTRLASMHQLNDLLASKYLTRLEFGSIRSPVPTTFAALGGLLATPVDVRAAVLRNDRFDWLVRLPSPAFETSSQVVVAPTWPPSASPLPRPIAAESSGPRLRWSDTEASSTRSGASVDVTVDVTEAS